MDTYSHIIEGLQEAVVVLLDGVLPAGVDKNSVANFWKVSFSAEVAQLVEQRTENPRVLSSILSLGTNEIRTNHTTKFEVEA